MKINQKATTRLEQNLLLGFDLQMVQSMHMLPGPLLGDYVKEYCVDSEVLRLKEERSSGISFDFSGVGAEESLYDHLLFQIETGFYLEEKEEAKKVAASLDHNGFYDGEETLVVKKVQALDPVGIATKGPREAMLVQLRESGKKQSLAYRILEESYELFLKRDEQKLCKKQKVSEDELASAISLVKTLTPYPGREFTKHMAHYVLPEVILSYKGRWQLTFVKEFYPACEIVRGGKQKDVEEAKKFLYQLHLRKNRLEYIVSQIAKKQHAYLLGKGEKALLTREEVRKNLDVSESTFSRILSEKYIETPIGVHPLGFFFARKSAGVSGDSSVERAKEILKTLIESENKKKPYPDEILVQLLSREGVICSRRSVAKYRAALNIPSSHQR